MNKQEAVVCSSLESVFREFVSEALRAQAVPASERTSSYLVGLLSDFATASPGPESRALGMELYEAASLDAGLRYLRLKEIADTTLFLSGVFLDYVEAKAASTEYYFTVGSRAYLSLGTLDQTYSDGELSFSQTYTDLGSRFEDFARALTYIADRELFPSSERALRLYETWMETGIERCRSRLLALGVSVPSAGNRSH